MIIPKPYQQRLVPTDLLLRSLFYGWSFEATNNADVAAGESINIHLANPSDSNRLCLLHYGDMSHEGEVALEVDTAPGTVSGGTVADVNNNNVGVGRATGMTVEQNVTFSGTTLHHRQVHSGTGTVRIFDGYKMALQPGEAVIVEVTDQSGGADEVGLHLSFIEIPVPP